MLPGHMTTESKNRLRVEKESLNPRRVASLFNLDTMRGQIGESCTVIIDVSVVETCF